MEIKVTSKTRTNAKRLLTFCGYDSRETRTMTLYELTHALQRAVNQDLVTMAQVRRALEIDRTPPKRDGEGTGNGKADEAPETDQPEDDTTEDETGGAADDAGDGDDNGEGGDAEGSEDGDAEGDDGDGEADESEGDADESNSDDECDDGDEGNGDSEESEDGEMTEQDDDAGTKAAEDAEDEDDDESESDDSESEDEDEDDDSEIEHPVVERLMKYLSAGLNVALVGPAGTGKSYIARQAAAKLGRDFYVNGAMMSKYDLIGYNDAHGTYHETPAYQAFTRGGVHCFDELDASAPDAVVAFNGMTDDQPFYTFPNGQHEKHADYTAIACMNTFGNGATADYVGRYKQDAAAMDRFVLLHVDYDERIEKRIAGKHTDILQRVRAVRQACDELGIRHIVSYRMISKAVKARMQKIAKRDIDRDIIFAGLDDGAVSQIKTRVNAIIREA